MSNQSPQIILSMFAILLSATFPQMAIAGANLEADWTAWTNRAQLSESGRSYNKAASEYRSALKVAESLGANSKQAQLSLASVAENLVRSHETSLAEPYFLRALEISSQHKSAQDPDVGLSLSDLSDAYSEEALTSRSDAIVERCLNHSIRIGDAINPPDHSKQARNFDRLASLFLKERRFNEASSMMEQVVLNTNMKWWLPDPKLIQPYRKLAATLEEEKKLNEAVIYLKRAMNICETLKEPPVLTNQVRKDLDRVSKMTSARQSILQAVAGHDKK